MMLDKSVSAEALLEKCQECGIFAVDCPEDILDIDLIESGIIDSMSLTMLAEMLKKNYSIELTPQHFVVELRTLNDISLYIDNQ